MWERLAGLKKKKSNMFMMEADVFQKTPLSKKASANGVEVDGVPTVLYVSPNGTIQKADDIRNESAMTNVVMTGSPVEAVKNVEAPVDAPVENVISPLPVENVISPLPVENVISPLPVENALPPLPVSLAEVSKESEPVLETMPETNTEFDMDSDSESEAETETNAIKNLPANFTMASPPSTETNDLIAPIASSTFTSVLPGVEITQDILHDLPAATVHTNKPTIVQSGGSPWAAFLSSVAPAATLLGAYALLPKKRNPRSSGLTRVSRRNKKMTRASTA